MATLTPDIDSRPSFVYRYTVVYTQLLNILASCWEHALFCCCILTFSVLELLPEIDMESLKYKSCSMEFHRCVVYYTLFRSIIYIYSCIWYFIWFQYYWIQFYDDILYFWIQDFDDTKSLIFFHIFLSTSRSQPKSSVTFIHSSVSSHTSWWKNHQIYNWIAKKKAKVGQCCLKVCDLTSKDLF